MTATTYRRRTEYDLTWLRLALPAWRRLTGAGWQVVRGEMDTFTTRSGRWQVLLACPLLNRSRPAEVVRGDRDYVWIWQQYPGARVCVAGAGDGGWQWIGELAELAGLTLLTPEELRTAPTGSWRGLPIHVVLQVRPPMPYDAFDDLVDEVAELVRARSDAPVDVEQLGYGLWRQLHPDLEGTPLDPGMRQEWSDEDAAPWQAGGRR